MPFASVTASGPQAPDGDQVPDGAADPDDDGT